MNPLPIPSKASENQNSSDKSHLNIIAIFHYVLGGLSICSIGFFILHYFVMDMMINDPEVWEQTNHSKPPMPGAFLSIFIVFYFIGGIISLVTGILLIASGRFIHKLKNRTFSMVIAAISCLFFPFGTILGIFTLIKLSSNSVEELYLTSQ